MKTCICRVLQSIPSRLETFLNNEFSMAENQSITSEADDEILVEVF